MNTLVLIVDRESFWSPEKWAIDQGAVRGIGNQVVIEKGAEWLSIVHDDKVIADFDDKERYRLGHLINSPTIYLIEWRGNGTLVELLLRSVSKENRVAVDNDNGLLVDVQEVADRPLQSWIRLSRIL